MPTISFHFAEALFNALGVSSDQTIKGQLSRALKGMEYDRSAKIPLRVLEQLFALYAYDKKDIGLTAYEKAHPGNLGILGYAVMSSPTIDQALQTMVDHHALIGRGFCMSLERAPATVRIAGNTDKQTDFELPRTFIDAVAAITLGLLHWLAPNGRIMPLRAEFTYEKPDDTRALERVFGTQLEFSMAQNALTFDRQACSLPLATANAELQRLHSGLLKKHQPVVAQTAQARARKVIEQRLGRDSLRLADISAALNLSAHQLTRLLENEGQTFQQLLAQVRCQRAQQLLMDRTLPLKQVSFSLGFKNQSAFNKACERWFEMPPGLYRAAIVNKHIVLDEQRDEFIS